VAFDSYIKVQSDEQVAALRALRERVGLATNANPATLDAERAALYQEGLRALALRWPPSTVSDFVDHIDYAVRLVGIDHVGISSDFGGGGGVVGWNDAAETANVTAELGARGYTEADIEKLWSGNLLRVWRDVERVAAEIARSDP
jgi:membrane dipeptidase